MQPNDPRPDESPEVQDASHAVAAFEDDAMQADPGAAPTALPAVDPVVWQAPEYIQQHKTPLWYVGFFVVVAVLIAVAIWLQAWTFVVLVPVMAAALIIYTHRPPRDVHYAVSDKGLHINDQLHPLGEFKSFGVIDEHGMHSLVMRPIKRFRPGLTVYFPTEVGEALVDFLGAYLPMENVSPDAFDRIIQRLRI